MLCRSYAGFGLSQRLLALADAAISAEGGDPFCTATPLPPRPTAAAAAAGRVSATAPLAAAALPGNGDVTQSTRGVSNITGSKCEWWECLERVRLAHESLLLLRALMATMEPVGERQVICWICVLVVGARAFLIIVHEGGHSLLSCC